MGVGSSLEFQEHKDFSDSQQLILHIMDAGLDLEVFSHGGVVTVVSKESS